MTLLQVPLWSASMLAMISSKDPISTLGRGALPKEPNRSLYLRSRSVARSTSCRACRLPLLP